MNILHVISTPGSGGAEVYVKDLAKHLSKEGHSLHVAFLSSATDVGRDTEYEKEFLKDLELSGVNTYVIGNETRKKPWLGALRIRGYIRKHDIEIMHTHLAYGIIFSALAKIPVVYTHHTIEQRWNTKVYSVFNKLVDEYVGISTKCAKALESYTNRSVTIINNAVSEDKFSGHVRQRYIKDIVNFAMVGQLIYQKDYMNMLQALTLLDESVLKRVKVRVAGEGSFQYKDDLLNFVNKNGLNNFVNFVGVKTNIPEFLFQSDVFLMSSSSEGLPIALTEAVMSGLPCIVTDVGGCSEVIERSSNGIVVKPQDPQALADEITKLVLDDSIIKHLSQNAIDSADQYSISKAADLHIDLYTSMLG